MSSTPSLYDIVLANLAGTSRTDPAGRRLTDQQWHAAVAGAVERTVADHLGRITLARKPDRPGPVADPRTDQAQRCLFTCAQVLGVEVADILHGSRRRPLAEARQIAAYVIRRHTGLSYPAIGQALQLEHTTVLYACRKVVDRIGAEPWWRQRVDACLAAIHTGQQITLRPAAA